ncbi:uncharacterized protein M6B38_332530 [Iris pallida]|uniref:Uncharacterized protein n=1 Tax=Iris pallida TaxID=29817 RepID=A0AAX6H4A5_IRIPA|nr:uncharacterized protein M6B38_332530 [Iris pallida]
MRRSTGVGGGRMLRAMGRAVGGAKEAVAATGGARGAKAARAVSMSPPASSSPPSFAVSASGGGSVTCLVDGDEWERVGEEVEEGVGDIGGAGFGGFSERFVFGDVPSREEAEDAVSTLQQIFVPVTFSQVTEDIYPSPRSEVTVDKMITLTDVTQGLSSSESESDWIEPAMHLYSSRASQSYEHGKVLDAFRLLQINPSVQRMVVSLSSDKAVWDAVMKNEVVQEFQKTVYEAENSEPQAADKGHNILKWILDGTKAKIAEFFGKITELVNDIFRSQEKEKETDSFDDLLRSSFMLSVVVFIIVVAMRVQKA